MSDEETVLVFGKPGDSFELLDESRQVALPVQELRRNLQDFLSSLKSLLPEETETAAGMKLKAVTVAVGIDGKGKVGFLGTGVEVGGNATLTLSFQRD